MRSYYPGPAVTGPVWALPRSLATTGGIIVYFLFLEVLRCFSSLGSPPCIRTDDSPSDCRVVPFGNPRIKGHLHLPAAYRSLSRPSSPPRAKASAVRPSILSRSTTTLACCCSSYFQLLISDLLSNLQSCLCQYVKDLFPLFQGLVENNGFEPLTPCLQSRCSSQLS